jgi:lipid-A-disaccharide synthase
MLYRKKPSVIVYRVSAFALKAAHRFKTTRFICLVNLLANKELFPEFLTARDETTAIAGHLSRWLEDPPAYHEMVDELTALCRSVAIPGACARAAEAVLDSLAEGQILRRAG